MKFVISKKEMDTPLTGQNVTIEYLEIDEIEAKCWIKDYSMIGFLDNFKLKLKLSDVGEKDVAQITSIDKETGRIELNSFRF